MRNRSVTSYDVARRAGVSQSTVSRALRDDPRVTPDTRERIRELAQEMGYVPHLTARSLITRRSSSIAVISGDLRNPSYPTLVNSLQDRLSRDGYRMLMLADRVESNQDDDIRALRGGLVDGVVFISARIDSPIVSELIDWNIPLVILNRDVDGAQAGRVDRVTSDNVGGGALVADHLVALRHRRIGVISGPAENPSVRLRERGLRERLARHGVDFDESLLIRGPIDATTGITAATELLTRPDRPTALFCATDFLAYGAIDAAKRLGMAVPGDISVMGYNDLDASGWAIFDLTTVRQPLAEMARTAAELLLARIDGAAGRPVHRRFDVELVKRGSTGPAIEP